MVREIGARYGERRLSAVPGWWNNKKGMLHDDKDSRKGEKMNKKDLTYEDIKPVKGAHRRMSTLTSSVRKVKNAGGKEELLKYYSCTFQPKINARSRKIDAMGKRMGKVS